MRGSPIAYIFLLRGFLVRMPSLRHLRHSLLRKGLTKNDMGRKPSIRDVFLAPRAIRNIRIPRVSFSPWRRVNLIAIEDCVGGAAFIHTCFSQREFALNVLVLLLVVVEEAEDDDTGKIDDRGQRAEEQFYVE